VGVSCFSPMKSDHLNISLIRADVELAHSLLTPERMGPAFKRSMSKYCYKKNSLLIKWLNPCSHEEIKKVQYPSLASSMCCNRRSLVFYDVVIFLIIILLVSVMMNDCGFSHWSYQVFHLRPLRGNRRCAFTATASPILFMQLCAFNSSF
jgi:hypothetical protein